MSVLKRFRSLFAWRTVRNSGAWLYQENAVTGLRRALKIMGSGYQPVDDNWIERR